MRKFLIGLLISCISLSLIALYLEGLPENNTTPIPKIKVYVQIIAENDDLKKYGEDALLDAMSTLDNVKPVLKYDKDVRFTLTVVLLEALANPKQKTGNIAAAVQYIDYFDNRVIKEHVATVNWEHVNNKTENLINHTQVGLLLFSKQPDEMKKTVNIVVTKLQEYITERH